MSLISIFEQPTTRTQLLDDLFELQAFLAQYAADLAGGASVSTLPSGLQLDRAEAGARLAAVNEAIEALDDEHARHLLLLGASPRYLDRQVASLRQMLDSSAKMRARAEEMQTRQAEHPSRSRVPSLGTRGSWARSRRQRTSLRLPSPSTLMGAAST